jgi:hypothetical protein
MTDTSSAPPLVWAGRIMSALVVLVLLADAGVQLFAPNLLRPAMDASGFPIQLAPVLGTIMLICAVLYALPQTATLGAIVVTGFLGGAICTHVRLGEFGSPPQVICLLLGLMAWGGLYLRDTRIRALLPIG